MPLTNKSAYLGRKRKRYSMDLMKRKVPKTQYVVNTIK